MPFKGDAGFKYTDPDTAATVTVELEIGLREKRPGLGGLRYEEWSLDLTARDVVEVATPVHDMWGRIRFHPDHAELRALLRHGLNDVTLNYYPSLADTGTSYPCKLVAVEDANGRRLRLRGDEDRFGHGEFEARLHLRRVDGGNFDAIFS